MSIRIEAYEQRHREIWDTFVGRSRNGTFFHTRRFLSYHPAERFTDASLLFFDGDRLVALLPAAVIHEEGRDVLVSHPGASYGGLVLHADNGMKKTGEAVDALMQHAHEMQYGAVKFMRLTPPSVRRAFSDDQEYWLHRTGWSVVRFELATSLFLDGVQNEDSLFHLYDGKCRNAVRQGQRGGLRVELHDDFDAFWPIIESTLAERHQTKPTHTLDEIKKLHRMAEGRVRLIAAFEDQTMVAGIVFVTLHDQAVYTLYIAQEFAYQQKRPLPLLVHELAKLCMEENRRVLHFGISTEDAGKSVNDGLFFFKESFGGVSVRRESWECMIQS